MWTSISPMLFLVVDSFHVTQWLIREIDYFLKQLMNRFRERDANKQLQLSLKLGRTVSLPVSDEVYLLKKFRWLILKNQSTINYSKEKWFDHHFRYWMDTYDYESKLLAVNPYLKDLRDYKELYVQFNERYAGNTEGASRRLDWLIQFYRTTPYQVFHKFADLLEKYRESILNSFIMISREGPGGLYDSRLSNGPIESMNRKVKDLKRSGRGFRNFEHLRNRFLFATRKQPVINGSSINYPVSYYEED